MKRKLEPDTRTEQQKREDSYCYEHGCDSPCQWCSWADEIEARAAAKEPK